MAEIENKGFFKGFDFDYLPIRKNLYDLYSYFASAYYDKDYGADLIPMALENLKEEFFYEQVSQKIIEIAILVREIINRCEADPEESYGHICTCGILFVNIKTSTETTTLTLREACNKIIHSGQVNFDDSKPLIYLYGQQNKKSWKAEVDILSFINGCFCISNSRSMTEYYAHQSTEKRAKFLPYKK